MQKHILLVEDDEAIREMVANFLLLEGFEVTTANNGEEALQYCLNQTFDLVILDIMIPKLNGLEVLKVIREQAALPIIIMSAKDSDVDKALGLGLGADDYIAKPFSMLEFSARVKAVIRRATKYAGQTDHKQDVVVIGDLKIDIVNFSINKSGQEVKLTSKEFAILKLFVTNRNRVFTKEQIYQLIWKDAYYGDENIINVHIRRLREKIEDDPSTPQYIKTLWGIGYKFEG
ncbi:response regulator transcription factor [Lysinibacillus sp. FSL M8-0216]|uniref:DNA-binding response regulator, OmpR family, contains REC and winged-helix (WHTH) domain n=1 Tax=Lysinibacillus fusiformis TaxID=28031 RepID=A0A1H9QFP9_9BACI|nr:response regulator transcription factor [Lysinibacillus fusiformis]HAU33362.1 DNA-binding response regulator [Lysinibacillus sp.]MCG7433491.1 response regulator transcription factor [Lysinibacillus fusiformis]SCX53934.1 DNA-binding response regulator, OmpR family, contains REC and winged-helix (wHTH) domain [Lysinibacillus fusiformis]SCY76358.1 DNA-binding response regulator, OmpR family, contains REC and winged-helix (wHTH) domain [Lysinibacillus fusiformis]SDB31376.1 DNA-binding response 